MCALNGELRAVQGTPRDRYITQLFLFRSRYEGRRRQRRPSCVLSGSWRTPDATQSLASASVWMATALDTVCGLPRMVIELTVTSSMAPTSDRMASHSHA